MPTQPVSDFWWYFQRAGEIASGKGYSVDGRPTAYWPVGFPFFLALLIKFFGAKLLILKAANLLLGLGNLAIAMALARRWFASGYVAILTGLLLAILPSLTAYSAILAAEPLFTFLVLCALWFLAPSKNGSRALAGGLVLGLACLVRPQAVALLPMIALCNLFSFEDASSRIELQRMALAGLALALVLFPWTVRNYRHFASFVFVSTNGGDNLLIGNGPGASGRYRSPERSGLYRPKQLSETARDRWATAFTMAYVVQYGLPSFEVQQEKLRETFGHANDAAWWGFQLERGRITNPQSGPRRAEFVGFRDWATRANGWLWLGFAFSLLSAPLWGRSRIVPWHPVAFVLFTAGLALVFFGNPRFGQPALPFVAMQAAAPWGIWASNFVKRRPAFPPRNASATAKPNL